MRKRMWLRPDREKIPVVLLLVSISICFLLAGCSRDPGREVWVIGLDGADWDQLGPMMDRGELPHLAALRRGGASGVLRSDVPMISPILWNSIATGKTPDLHGVTWFMTDGPDGSKIPISSRERQVRTFWDIASEAGRTCGIVGWWATWPADPVNGWLASDYVAWHSFGVTGRSVVDEGKTWPPEFMALIEELMPLPRDIPESLLQRMVHLPASDLLPDPTKDPYSDPAAHLRQAIATSRGYTDVVLHQLDHDRPALMSVYYEGPDAVTHLFGDYQEPRLPWVSDADFAAYGDAVAEYWKWQDELVGELLAKRGPRTMVLVVSDHGFRVGAERRKEDQFDIDTADADHMPDGLVIINGDGVRPGSWINGSDIYDVAPTVLYAMGLPVGRDMTGHVLTEAFTRERRQAQPVTAVATHETAPLARNQGFESDEQSRENLKRMLMSLGYISGTPDKNGKETRSAGQVVNLATVLMRQGRFEEAVAKLREALADDPEHLEIRLNLAQALARSGDLPGSEKMYRELVAEVPDRLEFHQDLAICLGQSGNFEGALAAIDAGLAVAPDWVTGLAARGGYLFRLGRSAEAKGVLRRSLEMDPRQGGAYFNLGEILLAENDVEGAAEALRKAHELDPGDPKPALGLAGVLERRGEFDAALQVLNRTLELGGEDPSLLGEAGAVLLRSGRAADAVAPLEESRKLDPGNADVAGNLGLAYAMTGKLSEAVAAFEKVVALRPGLGDGHAQLGGLYSEDNRTGEAVAELKKAVALEPDNAQFHLGLGAAYHRANRHGPARKAYQEAIRLDPDLARAYYYLGMLERSEGHTAEEKKLMSKAHQLDPTLP